jgi:hypothetical protein
MRSLIGAFSASTSRKIGLRAIDDLVDNAFAVGCYVQLTQSGEQCQQASLSAASCQFASAIVIHVLTMRDILVTSYLVPRQSTRRYQGEQ